MPDSFIDQRERSNEELKSKGRIERETQWRNKVKGSSVLQNISKGITSLWKGCVNLFYSQLGRDKFSSPGAEQRHFGLQSSRGAGPSKQANEKNYNNKSNEKQVKESFQHGVRIGFLPARGSLLERAKPGEQGSIQLGTQYFTLESSVFIINPIQPTGKSFWFCPQTRPKSNNFYYLSITSQSRAPSPLSGCLHCLPTCSLLLLYLSVEYSE